MNTKRQDMFADHQPKEMDDIDRDIRVRKQGEAAAPALTIAWAIMVSKGIPYDQALTEVVVTHEDILAKFMRLKEDVPYTNYVRNVSKGFRPKGEAVETVHDAWTKPVYPMRTWFDSWKAGLVRLGVYREGDIK